MTDARIRELVVETTQGHAGRLRREAQFVFNYETGEPTRQVALGMPLRLQSYTGNVLPPAFTQNLPEGDLLRRIQRSLGRHERLTDMRLLAMLGDRQIGRLRFHEPGKQPASAQPVDLDDILHSGRSAELFEFLIERFMASGVSGVQPKVLAASLRTRDKAALVAPDLIVKSAGMDFPFLPPNEFLCMSAARRAGLPVPEFWLSDDHGLFVMRRFDLSEHGTLGFEDMATLLDKPRDSTGDYKYRGSHEAIARVVAALCPHSLQDYFSYVALSVLVRNGDAHLKNFGLLYNSPAERDSIRLSPLYDVVTTTIYKHMTYHSDQPVADHTLALKLDGARSYPDYRQLTDFGRRACLVDNPGAIIERLVDSLQDTLQQEQSRFRDAAEFAALTQAWRSGIRLSGQPARTAVSTVRTSTLCPEAPSLQELADQAVAAFWHANPLLEHILEQLLAAGHDADAPWLPGHTSAGTLHALKKSATPDVLELERRARKAVRAARRTQRMP